MPIDPQVSVNMSIYMYVQVSFTHMSGLVSK